MKFTRRACNFASASFTHKSSPAQARTTAPGSRDATFGAAKIILFVSFHINAVFIKNRLGFPLPSHSPFSPLYFAFHPIFVQQTVKTYENACYTTYSGLLVFSFFKKKKNSTLIKATEINSNAYDNNQGAMSLIC